MVIEMNNSDLELRLLEGCPIEIEGLGKMHIPTLREINRIGESVYQQYISYLLIDKKNVDNMEKEDISNFQLVTLYCYHDENFRNIFLNALKMIFKDEAHLFVNEQDVFFYLGELKDLRIIDESKMEMVRFVIRKANHIRDEEKDYDPANERAKKFIEKLKLKKKLAPKPKETMNLHSIISGLAWKSNNLNILDIFNLTMYQLYDAFARVEGIDNYSSTLTGVYSGTIDSKNINFAQIHWAKVINLK